MSRHEIDRHSRIARVRYRADHAGTGEIGTRHSERDHDQRPYEIEEASDDIEAALGFRLVRETAVETFWHEQYDVAPEKFVLDRTPVAAIASVVVDGVTIDASAYRLDPSTGELFALGNGYPSVWVFCRSVVVSSGSMPDTRAAASSTFVTRARVLRNGAGRASSAAGLKRCSAPARGSVRGRAERAHAASVWCYS